MIDIICETTIIINGAQIKDLLCNRIRKYSMRENTYDIFIREEEKERFALYNFVFQFFTSFLLSSSLINRQSSGRQSFIFSRWHTQETFGWSAFCGRP